MPRPKRDLIRYGYKSKTEKQVNLPIIYTRVPETERMIKMPVSYYLNSKKNEGLVLNLDANDNTFSYPANSSIWYDTSGSRNNGTLSGTYSLVDGKAIRFGDANSVGNITSRCVTSIRSSLFNQPNSVFSFAICLNLSNIVNAVGSTRRALSAERSLNSIAWALQHNTSSDLTLFGYTVVNFSNLVVDRYYFIYGSYNNGYINIFLNGNFIRTNATFIMPVSTTTAGNITVSGRPLAFGNPSWNGNIAFVKMYNRVLDNIEVKDLYDKYKRQYALPYV